MRNLAFIPLALLCIGAAPPRGEPAPMPAQTAPELNPHSFDRMNVMRARPNCESIPRQVAGDDRRYDGTRLDQQPPGRLILAVERHVNGCPEVAFANETRRSTRPIFPEAK
ncbi:MAG TPA: hypothetical protein VEC11_01935 [Allosphingosinicella sp.]|nr:hypothetical protein [Allosphingosinicella sp.]